MTSLNQYRATLIALIDRGAWKHSWHLPKNNYGEIDWANPETLKTIERILHKSEWKYQQFGNEIEKAKTALEILTCTIEETK